MEEVQTRTRWILGVYGAGVLLALAISGLREDTSVYRIGLMSPILGVGTGLLLVALSRALTHEFAWARDLHREFRAVLGPLGTSDIFILAAASSVGEELLFRGALLPILGVWGQALLFAGFHIGPERRYLPWTVAALVVGVGFGYLTQATGDVGAAIVAHFLINFLNLSFITRVSLAEDLHKASPVS